MSVYLKRLVLVVFVKTDINVFLTTSKRYADIYR